MAELKSIVLNGEIYISEDDVIENINQIREDIIKNDAEIQKIREEAVENLKREIIFKLEQSLGLKPLDCDRDL